MVNAYEISKEIASDEEGYEVVKYLADHFKIKLANEPVTPEGPVKPKRLLEVDLEVSQESLDTMIEMAGYGMRYWAIEAEDDEDARTYTITENEEGEFTKHVLTYDQIIEAFWKIANPGDHTKGVGPMVTGYAVSAVIDGVRNGEGDIEAGHVDADLADSIMQVACFGEAIYG